MQATRRRARGAVAVSSRAPPADGITFEAYASRPRRRMKKPALGKSGLNSKPAMDQRIVVGGGSGAPTVGPVPGTGAGGGATAATGAPLACEPAGAAAAVVAVPGGGPPGITT